jgi:peptide/nickel transport system substrate-binding protein
LTANPNYFEKKPFISKITLNFYSDDDSALIAYNQKEVMGINSLSPQKLDQIALSKSTYIYRLNIPRYFAVFFNQTKSFPLANDEVREALAYATNREAIIENVLDGNGLPVYSPILPEMIGFDDKIEKRDFDLEKAQKILEDNKWLKGDDGIRSKGGKVLEINLITTDWNDLVQTAELLKEQWEKIGAKVNVNSLSISDIQQNYIRPREYEALLFGQTLGANPDYSSFWHSREKKDPGSNLALFGDDETDKLIDDGRIEFDNAKRAELYRKLQEKIAAEIPAIFLYSPEYIYPVNKKVQGIEIKTLVSPSCRFAEIAHWYIKTRRVWK